MRIFIFLTDLILILFLVWILHSTYKKGIEKGKREVKESGRRKKS